MISNIKGIKVITSPFKGASSVEILNSNAIGLDEFTLCFRIFSHQFNHGFQPIISFPFLDSYTVSIPASFGTMGTPCAESFFGGGKLRPNLSKTNVANVMVNVKNVEFSNS